MQIYWVLTVETSKRDGTPWFIDPVAAHQGRPYRLARAWCQAGICRIGGGVVEYALRIVRFGVKLRHVGHAGPIMRGC